MATQVPFEMTATCDTPQLPEVSTLQNNESAENDPECIHKQGEQGSLPPEVTILSLQRDLQALRSKISRIETEAGLEIDSDTDDEIPEFGKNIRESPDAWPDEETQDKIIETWRTRRKVARDIIRKSNRLRKLREQGRLKPRHLNDPDFSDEDEDIFKPKDPMENVQEVLPILESCAWGDFANSRNAKSKKSAIYVLIGKPPVSWRRGRTYAASDEQMDGPRVETIPAKSMPLGTLPDRIRIRSRLLLLMFANLHQVSLDMMFQNHDSFVFLRPFKLLVYFQEDLRDRFAKLIERHREESNTDVQSSSTVVEGTASTTQITNPGNVSPSEQIGDSSDSDPSNTSSANEVAELHAKEVSALSSRLMLEHMRPLIQFLDDYIVPRQTYLRGPLCDKITFQDLWLIYEPGVEVIQSDGNQAYRIVRIRTRAHKAIPPWKGFEKQAAPRTDSSGDPVPDPSAPFINEGDDKPFTIWCVYIDSDGLSVGPVTKMVEIKAFEDEKHITDLPVYPLRLRRKNILDSAESNALIGSEQGPVREQLIERGKRFLEMSAIKHANYSGPKYGTRERLEDQVVIDNSLVFEHDKTKVPPGLSTWVQTVPPIRTFDIPSDVCYATCCSAELVHTDGSFDQRRNDEYLETAFPTTSKGMPPLASLERQISEVQADMRADKITNDDYVIMSDRVHGFVLKTREWVELDLRFIRPVEDSREKPESATQPQDTYVTNTAFDDLVLPPGHKQVILSLVAQHFRGDGHHEVDIIKGKGKGLILLLHGAPGVGKTSTAEGVAEAFKRPLLQITSGDLGIIADKVGESLQRNFDLASRWGCVLLLDEADVFLASRTSAESSSDLNRNALVAVFLRVLEYYTGILFLTTNRIGDFDEAFASRIHLSLEYPQLDKTSTQSILALNMGIIKRRFKESGRMLDIEETKICTKFADYWDEHESSRLNGRQIRNACQTALALAEFEAQGKSHKDVLKPDATVRLRPSHFDTILDAYLDFAVYLNNTYGISPDQRAKEQKLRAKQRSERKARVKPTYAHAESADSHAGGFGGAHLYNQSPAQHPAPVQFPFQSAVPGTGSSGYTMPPQFQQPFQAPMPVHSGFQNMQIPGSNPTLFDLMAQNAQRQVNAYAYRQANTPNPQRMSNEMEDTHAGHGAHYQGHPANPDSAAQYPQSQ